MQASVPGGWSPSLAQTTLSINPGASANTTLQVTSPANAAGGAYPVGVTASNISQLVYNGSASGTYVISSPPSITLVSNQASYSRNQTATITALVSAQGSAVVGATVAFTITGSNGSSGKGSGVTGSNGVATFKYTFRKKNPTGTYQVLGKTNVTGTAISARQPALWSISNSRIEFGGHLTLNRALVVQPLPEEEMRDPKRTFPFLLHRLCDWAKALTPRDARQVIVGPAPPELELLLGQWRPAELEG